MNIKEILETTTQGISFPTPIGEVCLSVEKCRMNLLMQKYKAVVDSAKEKFLSQCTAEPQNEEDLAEIQSIFADCKEDIYREMKKKCSGNQCGRLYIKFGESCGFAEFFPGF